MIVGDVLDTQGKWMKEEEELWLQDPVEVVRDLLGRLSLRDVTIYAPARAYTGEDHYTRIYDEMWTGAWWYETQVSCLLFF